MCACSAVVVFRPAADVPELDLLLTGAIDVSSTWRSRALATAYHSLMTSSDVVCEGSGTVFRRRYGLRDFYNFGRYIARHGRAVDDPTLILRALERNFNGGTESEFDAIAGVFLSELERADPARAACVEGDWAARATARLGALKRRPVVQVLREALTHAPPDARRLNETIVRYQLILDQSEDDSSARLLFQCGVLDRRHTRVYDLSDFPCDRNDVVRSMMINRIKRAMTTDTTLFLMHTAPIHGSLYDLLNQHFTRMQKREETVYYANVAVGSYSRPCEVSVCSIQLLLSFVLLLIPTRCFHLVSLCLFKLFVSHGGVFVAIPFPAQVHPKFRLIVHLPTSIRAPAPFYNRFEKYLVTVSNVWRALLADPSMPQPDRDMLSQVLPLVSLPLRIA